MSERRKAWLGDALGIGIVVLAAVAYLSPAIADGFTFGPVDSGSALVAGHLLPLHQHNRLNGDLITQMIPWNTLDWRLVHHGQLPLWNRYTLLGAPLAFNFESAAFSLPDLVGYLFPLSESFFVAVFIKLAIAGTGTYVFCRVLGARPVASAFGGITFMLSGAFVNWLGWPLSDVLAWSGWLAALSLLVYRGRGRRYVVLLALAVAFTCFGGFPEAYVLIALCLGAFLAAAALVEVGKRRRVAWRGVARLTVAGAAGLCLAAPLLLPGVQLLQGSVRAHVHSGTGTFDASQLSNAIAGGYFGLSIRGSVWFGQANYYEAVAYVGVIALVLAAVGVVSSWRRPAVVGLLVCTVVAVLATYHFGSFNPIAHLANTENLGSVQLTRARAFGGFGVAVLAALGLDRLLRAPTRSVRVTFALSSLAVALLVGWLVVDSVSQHLVPVLGNERFDSLVWPVALALGLVAVSAVVLVAGRHNRPWSRATRAGLATLVVAAQGAFLVFAGVGINSYSKVLWPSNRLLDATRASVGQGLLGFTGATVINKHAFRLLGLYPDMNAAYELAIFCARDPLTPVGYYRVFPPTADHRLTRESTIKPNITSAAQARQFGIGYLLAPAVAPQIPGTVLIWSKEGETLYRVPGAARFSFAGGAGAGTVTAVRQPTDRSYELKVDAPRASVLVLRVTDVPGWHVSADGIPLIVRPYDQVMMSVVVPPGRQTVTLSYWPERFSEGLWLAFAATVGFMAWGVAAAFGTRLRWRGAHARKPGASD